ncbi:FUSC family protein [Tamlana sp. 2201CG12-4]|uniref:FUSC family protein n=1 Tax=Tamlana sp. 2201CG12-4 TaxID=3112582 RepID=UPI002DBB4EE0|nr:FUSC family protein [Tamlana sp. 2201CG12-4]MEC3908528.1 FUSC family protein [Tamlana sp. 2201CG12-4]
MKKLFTVLTVVASILAIILAALPVSNLAIIPSITSLIFGLIAIYLSKKSGHIKKIITFSFLLTIMSLVLITYKAIFTITEVTNTEDLKATETKLEEEAIEELEELEIEETDLEELEIEQ